MSENLGRGRPVLVVGAGFSGLVSAYYLNKAGFQVSVIEAKEHAGGLISSIQTSDGLIETAANGLLANRDVELMLADIGVQAMETESHANRRYILREGRARRWPLSFSASLRVAWFVVRFMLARSRVQPRAKETTSAWATRVMGEEASAYLVQTALQGIYAGDPNRMSASLVFGRFFSKTNRAARAKNFRGTVAPKDGMGAVISGLEGYLKRQGVQFSYGKPISATEITQLRKSQPVVAALSANAALKVAGTEGRVAEVLSKIEMLPLVSATFFFEQTDKRSLGFGVLFPAQERRAALGVLKNDFIFDYRANIGLHSETWILGGANDPSVISLNDEQIRDRVLRERNAVFHLTDAPTSMRVTRWPTALPHYTTELESDISAIQGIHENLALVGNYLGSIGLSQIVVRLKSLPKTLADEGKWS